MQQHSEPKVSALLKKLDDMYDELKSDAHYEGTPSVAYGHHDPFDVPVTLCEVCSKPRIWSSRRPDLAGIMYAHAAGNPGPFANIRGRPSLSGTRSISTTPTIGLCLCSV